jgi:hypothetical protein
MSWRNSVNQTFGIARITDINTFVRAEAFTEETPIDIFYQASKDILLVGTPAFLSAHPSMGPLLLVGLVSATENYFRDIFSRLIQICPIAKATSADQSIKLGSVVWHGGRDVERGAFEHISFADVDTVIRASRNFLKYELQKTDTLLEFGKVCELRHGIVHSGAVLAGKNALNLQLPATTGTLRIEVGFAQLQECGAICTSLVASVNTELFSEMAKRWAVNWPRLPSWNIHQKHDLFKAIWNIFFSKQDAHSAAIPLSLSLTKCKNRVSSEFS